MCSQYEPGCSRSCVGHASRKPPVNVDGESVRLQAQWQSAALAECCGGEANKVKNSWSPLHLAADWLTAFTFSSSLFPFGVLRFWATSLSFLAVVVVSTTSIANTLAITTTDEQSDASGPVAHDKHRTYSAKHFDSSAR